MLRRPSSVRAALRVNLLKRRPISNCASRESSNAQIFQSLGATDGIHFSMRAVNGKRFLVPLWLWPVRVRLRLVVLPMIIETPRLRLRFWQDTDRAVFAAMNADPEVMDDLGGPIGVTESDAKFDRYAAALHQRGFSRWLIETHDGNFVGYTGVLKAHHPNHPLGEHFEIGWRLIRSAWGRGYATEAARAALEDSLTRVRLPEVLAYTAPENARSRAVMERLALRRDPSRDFTTRYDKGEWRGLVWFARP